MSKRPKTLAQHTDKMRKAVVLMLRTEPFFASIIMSHTWQWTAGDVFHTDGKTLTAGTEYIASKTVTELCDVLKHQALHVALGHCLRRAGYADWENLQTAERRDAVEQRLNIAGDLAVNSLLTGSTSTHLLDDCMPGAGQYSDMPQRENMEQYYKLLKERDEQEQQDNDNDGKDDQQQDANEDTESPQTDSDEQDGQDDAQQNSDNSSASDDNSENDDEDEAAESPQTASDTDTHPDAPSDSSEAGNGEENDESGEDSSTAPRNYNGSGSFSASQDDGSDSQQQQEERWRQMVCQAEVTASEAGKMPAFLKSAISDMLKPARVPWPQVLRRFLRRTTRTQTSYRRPSRRHGYRRDIIMPGKHGKTLGKMILGVDVSGSNIAQADKALSEMEAIASTYKDVEIVVVQWDTRVTDTRTYRRSDFPIKLDSFDWQGGGGTDVNSFLDACAGMQADVIVCLTDGMYGTPRSTLAVPTLWLQTYPFDVPFGEALDVTE